MKDLIERAKEVGFRRAALEAGAVVSDGPVPEDFATAWGIVPLKRSKVAHHWTAEHPEWLAKEMPEVTYMLSSACGLRSIGTKQWPLLGAGNMPYCSRCENKLIKEMRNV